MGIAWVLSDDYNKIEDEKEIEKILEKIKNGDSKLLLILTELCIINKKFKENTDKFHELLEKYKDDKISIERITDNFIRKLIKNKGFIELCKKY